MKRTTLFLDEKLQRQLKQIAHRRGVSFAAVVREAMQSYVATPTGQASVPSVAGQFASGQSDTSVRVDELLWKKPHV
jgi:hypothetical protein